MNRLESLGTATFTSHGWADLPAVSLGNVNGEMAGLTVSEPPTLTEVQALREALLALAAVKRGV